MKTTTTLHEIIQSELIQLGKSEFVNETGNQLTFFDDDYAFIQKIARFDDDVYNIVNIKFFAGLTLATPESDRSFKRLFTNRFSSREIGFQTMERFRQAVMTVFLQKEHYLNVLYDDLDDYINQATSSNDKQKGNSQRDYRLLDSDLPQDNINLNVDDTVLNYGDRNTITRERTIKDETGNRQSQRKSLDDLIKSKDLLKNVFDEFDKSCFLHVY